MTGVAPNARKAIISAQDCARGILDNASSGMTYGGTVHKITGFITKFFIDMVPHCIVVKVAGSVGKQIIDDKNASTKAQ